MTPGTTIVIVDPETEKPVQKRGLVGEIWVSSQLNNSGYHRMQKDFLDAHFGMPKQTVYLWQCLILFACVFLYYDRTCARWISWSQVCADLIFGVHLRRPSARDGRTGGDAHD